MRKRIITVPKDKVAEKLLDFDEAKEEDLIELLIKENEFLFMCQNGIIELINNEGNTNIDDFEDDSVIGKDNIRKVIKALNLKNNIQCQLIKNILALFKEAFNRDTGVYFFF